MDGAVMRSQSYAITIEHIMENVFGCDRFGVAGVVNSDFIRTNPLAAVLTTCGYLYADAAKQTQVERFIEETRFYLEMTIDELLSFETFTKTVGIRTIELEYENGEKALEDIIEKFRKLCE